MVVIAGCLIVKDNKILMVQESKKSCYGQWNFPAGHVEEPEKITDAAIREVYEETGYKVKLTGVLPIIVEAKPGESEKIHVRFLAEVVENDEKYNKKEILDIKWIEIDKIKNMSREELREYDLNNKPIEYFENNKIYPLEILDEIFVL